MALGGRLLGEIETGKLDDLLHTIHRAHDSPTGHSHKPASLGIPALDQLWAQHRKHGNRGSAVKLEIVGPGGLSLLYHIVSVAVSSPRNGAVVVIDADGRFDVSRLTCDFEGLQHVYVFRPERGRAGLLECLKEVEGFLMDGEHESWGRNYVGTVVNGAQGGDVMVSWRGWLRAESGRGDVPRFGAGMSVDGALEAREERMVAVREKRWRARCEWGEYQWEDG